MLVPYSLLINNKEGIRYKHFKNINWLPVWERVKQFIAVSVFKFSNNLAPKYMGDIFQKSQNMRRTRSSNEFRINIPFRKNDYGKNCLSYLGATIWNKIDTPTKNCKTTNSFKHKIKDTFFRELKSNEESIYTKRKVHLYPMEQLIKSKMRKVIMMYIYFLHYFLTL